jgi:hypothetical protein
MCTLQCFTSRMVKCRVTGRQNFKTITPW